MRLMRIQGDEKEDKIKPKIEKINVFLDEMSKINDYSKLLK